MKLIYKHFCVYNRGYIAIPRAAAATWCIEDEPERLLQGAVKLDSNHG